MTLSDVNGPWVKKAVARGAVVSQTRAYAGAQGSLFLEFLNDAGLFGAGFDRPRFDTTLLTDLKERRTRFVGVNPGGRDIKIGALFAAIRKHAWLTPVRSGHVGDWDAIWSGTTPLLAYNRASTADLGLARPVIHALGLTETADLSAGDTIYLPGSRRDGPSYRQFELLATKGESGWHRLDRLAPRFIPWMWVETESGLENLARLQWQRMTDTAPVPMILEAELIWRHVGVVREWLQRYVEAAAASTPHGEITLLFGRATDRYGITRSVRLRYATSRCSMLVDGETEWTDVGPIDELLDLVLLPYEVIASPETGEAALRTRHRVAPLLSNRVTSIITAYLGVATSLAPSELGREPFTLMVEWGALSQGGCPPMNRGYFASRSNLRQMRAMARLFAVSNNLPALVHVMLPLAPLMLLPSSAAPDDADQLSQLFTRIAERTANDGDRAPRAFQNARDAVRESKRLTGVSPFYRSRFAGQRGVDVAPGLHGSFHAIELPELERLTLRQACLAAAALFEEWKSPECAR